MTRDRFKAFDDGLCIIYSLHCFDDIKVISEDWD